MTRLSVTLTSDDADRILVPCGITTPYEAVTDLEITGGDIMRVLREPDLGLAAALVAPKSAQLEITYHLSAITGPATYPEAAFTIRHNRFTTPAEALANNSREIAEAAGHGRAGIEALVREAESLFTYDHPEEGFNDGSDEVPYLSCGTRPGSCVDINTYLIASLRSAGYDAAYLYGYFFPEEKAGQTHDGHCWVVTRHEGEILEWDIAHHIKAGLGPTRAGLNPRPGQRVGISHSMGHRYRGLSDNAPLKILGEPMALRPDNSEAEATQIATLHP